MSQTLPAKNNKPVSLDLSEIKLFSPRNFLPQDIDLTRQDAVVSLYQALLNREIISTRELEEWLNDRSELEAAVDQAGTILYIRMTCQTDDPGRAKAYQNFMETVVPAIKPLEDQLNKKFLKALENFPLDLKRFMVYTRSLKSDVELFRQENVPLQTKLSLLSQEYQALCGSMTVQFQGEEKTLPQMGKYLFENDRALRESAWRAASKRRLQDKERLENIFDQMLKLRQQIAQNAGFQNFALYQFKAYHRFDYTPRECKIYHETVKNFLVQFLDELYEKRRTELKIDQLRPWDLLVDPSGLPPLRPFEKVEELIDGVKTIFSRTDPALGEQFKQMAGLGLLDLASRKGKAPGGYQSTLAEIRKPFIFMNAVGVDQDVRTLLHEGGHAFHALAAANQFLYSYRHAPMEFCEVASMAMEILGGEHMDIFYEKEDARRSKLGHLEDIIETLVWVATIDCFQFWIYEHPSHTPGERKDAWLSTRRAFSPAIVDWRGLEEEHSYLWHRQLHIFEVPFYYIEYGIAQLGALQLWQRFKKNPVEALELYKKGLALGGSRPLPEIFETTGIEFDFSKRIVLPLAQELKKEIGL